MMRVIENIRDSWKHIPYTLKHRKKLIELSEIYLGKREYLFHDLDKVFMYIFFPYLGTKLIHKIHATLSPHHVSYFRGISKIDKKQAILDWESARFTKPDKPMNAAETLVFKYPQYISEFSGYFYILGLDKDLEKLLFMANKFIIATKDHYIGELRFGMVDLHRDLKCKNESVYGGGTFEIDAKKKILKLSGKSDDFGLPIFNGWDKLKISSDWKGFKITYTYPYGCNHDNEVIDLTNKLEYDEDI